MTRFSIELLNEENKLKYDAFIRNHPARSLFNSLKFKLFLEKTIPNSNAIYILGMENGIPQLIFPIFLVRGKYGTVANSLPFFGSHGGPIHSEECPEHLYNMVFEYYEKICETNNVVTSTLIEPYQWQAKIDFKHLGFSIVDQRIGQVSELPNIEQGSFETDLYQMMHSKTRNLVRKALKKSFDIQVDNTKQSMNALYALHNLNMSKIGGMAKPKYVFENILSCLIPGEDFDIFVAKREQNIAAMLLLLYEGKTVEYFTPVIADEHRSDQPLSAIIFAAMKCASKNDFKNWNWGGTWLSQDGVYRFKSRWGAKDKRYNYWLKNHNESADIINQDPVTLVNEYPFFYTRPF